MLLLVAMAGAHGKTYIVEHLDEELGAWSELEYVAIAEESQTAGGTFLLSSLPPAFKVPHALRAIPAFTAETRGVEELYAQDKSRVCLLDPAAAQDLAPADGQAFDAFLFGGILGGWQLPQSCQRPAGMTADFCSAGDDPPRGERAAPIRLVHSARLGAL